VLVCLIFALGGAAQTGNKGVKVSPHDAAQFQTEKKLALIVGINDYQEESGLSKLKYAVSDAEELATALQSYGYVTDVLTDKRAIKVIIRRHLDDLLKRVEPDSGTVLFAFSGHGGQVGSVSYLATYDAGADSLDKDGIAVDEIKNQLAESKAARRMMFLDACRSVTAPGGKDSAAPVAPFMKLADAKGLRMLISTGAKTRSYESDPLRHGVFTYYLLAGLKGGAAGSDGLITFNGLADYVTDKVKESKPGQVPYTDGQSTGDFYLGGEYKAPAPQQQTSGALNLDAERFSAVKDSRDPEFLEKVASQLKDAQLAEVLRERAEAMRTANKAPERSVLKPRTVQSAELRKQADSLYANKDYAAAYPLYRQLADAGDLAGMTRVGFMYERGQGVARNPAQAVMWYRKAADAGDPAGMNYLGKLYMYGWTGVARDYAQAVSLFRKAANAGYPEAMNNLGIMYESGHGVELDGAQAVSWYRKAADAGCPGAMFGLGLVYFWGQDGVAKDEAQAASWFSKAADAGHPLAMSRRGYMYENGQGVARDDGQAVSWYRKAADAGDPGAMDALGQMYANGRGVAQDDTQAVRWFREAARYGHQPGMYHLGAMCETGRGVARDLQQAISWYRKAAEKGSQDAKQALTRLGQ
jgi:TPR repeat protein